MYAPTELADVLPDVEAVASVLQGWNREFDCEDLDVRLQVDPEYGFELHSGDSSFNTDHRGYWGASSIPCNGDDFDAYEVAEDLIEQVIESYYTSN